MKNNKLSDTIELMRAFADRLETIKIEYPGLCDAMDYAGLYENPMRVTFWPYTARVKEIAAQYPELPWERIDVGNRYHWAVKVCGVEIIYEGAEDKAQKPTVPPVRTFIPKDELCTEIQPDACVA